MDIRFVFLTKKRLMVALCFLLIGINSCKEEPKEKIPTNLISTDTMVLIITDFHLIESSLGIRIFEDKKMMNTRNILKSKIYKDYGVTKENFFESYNYYTQKNEIIDSIYANVLTEITKRQAKQLKQ